MVHKWVFLAPSLTCKSNSFPHMKACAPCGSRFENEVKSTRKWPIKAFPYMTKWTNQNSVLNISRVPLVISFPSLVEASSMWCLTNVIKIRCKTQIIKNTFYSQFLETSSNCSCWHTSVDVAVITCFTVQAIAVQSAFTITIDMVISARTVHHSANCVITNSVTLKIIIIT